MIREFTVLVLSILACSSIGLAAFNPKDYVDDYVSIIDRVGESCHHLIDDICGMMEIARRFRDDPDYHYNPADMDRIIMRDGFNGTQELIDVFNRLINATMREAETP
jgi:hypothetical protein